MHSKSIFAGHGTPEIVLLDNGPQYASQEYREFARKWRFILVTSSPYHPKANGKAERTVQTTKSLMKKASKNEEDPIRVLSSMSRFRWSSGTSLYVNESEFTDKIATNKGRNITTDQICSEETT